MPDREEQPDSPQKKWELYYPYIVAAIVAIGSFYYFASFGVPARFERLLNAIVSLAAIAVGFLGTAKTVFLSLGHTRIVRQMRRHDGEYYTRMMNFMMNGIKFHILLAGLSGLGLLVDFSNAATWHHWALSIWVFVLIGSACSCWRIITILSEILESPD